MSDVMDLADMEDDEILALLFSYGLDESLHDLSRDEMISLALSYQAVPDSNVQIPSPEGDSDILDQYEVRGEAAAAMVDSGGAAVAEDGLKDFVTTYVDITGVDSETAYHILEACGWDLEQAVIMHMSDSEQPHQRRTYSANSTIRNPQQQIFQDEVHGLGDFPGRIFPGSTVRNMSSSFPTPPTPPFSSLQDDYEDTYGIRRPDPVKQQRLIDAPLLFRRSNRDNPLSRADDPSVTWMFPPPRHLSFQGPFTEAKTTAMQSGKWLLVNIQSHIEFQSHMLNRDTWSSEIVENLIRSSFLLWQRGHTSEDAKSYMQLYAVSSEDDQLPHIAIIDSRTGVLIESIKGYIAPDRLAETLVEFLDRNSLTDGRAPRGRNADASHQDPHSQHNSSGTISTIPVDAIESKPYVDCAAKASSSSAEQTVTTNFTVVEKNPMDGNTLVGQLSTLPAGPHPVYGSSPAEPAASDADAIKISIRLASGKACIRFYRSSEKCEVLFAVAAEAEPLVMTASGYKPFDLFTPFPMKSIAAISGQSLQEAGLSNMQVIMRWI